MFLCRRIAYIWERHVSIDVGGLLPPPKAVQSQLEGVYHTLYAANTFTVTESLNTAHKEGAFSIFALSGNLVSFSIFAFQYANMFL